MSAEAELVPLSKLSAWAKNPRKNDAAVKRVADSIRKFGFANPILARRENGEIIAGHTRFKAAQMLKLQAVPVRYLDLSEEQAHLLAIADNKLGELAEWDDALLGNLLRDMTLGEAAIIGFDADELDKLAGSITDEDASEQLSGLAYQVVVKCDNETAQSELIERLESEGYTCSPLIS